MENNILLDNIIDKNSFLKILQREEFEENITKSFLSSDVFFKAISSIKILDNDQEIMFLSFMHFVDNEMKFGIKNIKNKITTILVGGIYIGEFYDKIKNYNLKHLMCISNFSVYCSYDDFYENLDVLDEEVFKSFQDKTKDYTYYNDFCELVMKLHEEGIENKEIINYFGKKTRKEILAEVSDYMDEIAEMRKFNF